MWRGRLSLASETFSSAHFCILLGCIVFSLLLLFPVSVKTGLCKLSQLVLDPEHQAACSSAFLCISHSWLHTWWYVSRFVSFSVFHYSRSFASPYKFWNQPVFFPAKHAGKFLIGALHQFRGELTTFWSMETSSLCLGFLSLILVISYCNWGYRSCPCF